MQILEYAFSGARVYSLPTGPLQENCILLMAEGGDALLFDPGDDAENILQLIDHLGAKVQGICLTHGHFDHVGAVEALRGALNVKVHLHEADLPNYENAAADAARYGLQVRQPSGPDAWLSDGQKLALGGLNLSVNALPGHAPGHVVFVPEDERPEFAIVGDTLFSGGVGRCDLRAGNEKQLLEGIFSKLLVLPDEAVFFAGHGPAGQIGHERRSNPYLQR